MANCPGYVVVPFVALRLCRDTGRGRGWGDHTGEDLEEERGVGQGPGAS